MFWCSLCSIVIIVHCVQLFVAIYFVQLFITTRGSIVCHYLSLKYGFIAYPFDCCSLLKWLLISKMCSLLLLFGLVACYWSTLVFVHGSSALVATCHASSNNPWKTGTRGYAKKLRTAQHWSLPLSAKCACRVESRIPTTRLVHYLKANLGSTPKIFLAFSLAYTDFALHAVPFKQHQSATRTTDDWCASGQQAATTKNL